MTAKGQERTYYVVTQNAIPDVLLKVVEVKRLLESRSALTVQEAVERVGISRSSFYKYKDDIFPFRDNVQGKTITFVLEMLQDAPGILSEVLHIVAQSGANILTIHQSLPAGGMASVTISVEVLPAVRDIGAMIQAIEKISGVKSLKILGSSTD